MIKRIFLFVVMILFVAVTGNAQKKAQYHCYKADTSKEVICFVDEERFSRFWNEMKEENDAYFSTDGRIFKKVMTNGGTYGGGEPEQVDFYVPETAIKGVWVLDRYKPTMKVNKKTFRRVKLNPKGLIFQGYPKIRDIEYVLEAQDGKFIVITDERYGEWRYEWKFLIGPMNDLREVNITDTEFNRCGAGSVVTAEGTLEYHTPDVADTDPATWQGKRLKHHWEGDYKLVTSKGKVSLVRKKVSK